MSQKRHILRITALVAISASAYLTVLILAAGIAAACTGPPPSCTEAPSATTTAATSVTYNSAYINGDVNPKNCEGTYVFEFKKAGGFWVTGFTHNMSGTVPQYASEWEPSLQPETTYEFRISASNSKGTTTGTVLKFTTPAKPTSPGPPIVTTEAATGVTMTSATLNGFVNPNGLSTTYKFEYGTSLEALNKSTPSVSVGTSEKVKAEVSNLEPETLYYFRISATNSNGTTLGGKPNFTTLAPIWKIKSTPNPAGASDSNLYDVSCKPTALACTAVGKSTVSGADRPVAQRWNGTTWSEQSPDKKSGTLPTRLFGVDCPSETRCLAAGSYQPLEGGPALLTEIWNEGNWNVQSVPLPAGATSSELVGIGCSSTAQCSAVGSAVIGGVKTAIAARWSSPTWTLQTIPLPAEAKWSQLEGVDCIWSNFCVAVGRYTNSSSVEKAFAMYWNGSWSLQTLPDPAGATRSALLDVSCTPSPSLCTAVGNWRILFGKGDRTLAYRFTGGSTWTVQSTPNPVETSAFHDVSCATETSCAAVGSWVPGVGEPSRTLAADWNGSSWSVQSSANPVGATFSSLFGVSCEETSCLGAGWSTDSSGVDTTLSEARE